MNRSEFLSRKEKNKRAISDHKKAILDARKEQYKEIKLVSGNASQIKRQIDRDYEESNKKKYSVVRKIHELQKSMIDKRNELNKKHLVQK